MFKKHMLVQAEEVPIISNYHKLDLLDLFLIKFRFIIKKGLIIIMSPNKYKIIIIIRTMIRKDSPPNRYPTRTIHKMISLSLSSTTIINLFKITIKFTQQMIKQFHMLRHQFLSMKILVRVWWQRKVHYLIEIDNYNFSLL